MIMISLENMFKINVDGNFLTEIHIKENDFVYVLKLEKVDYETLVSSLIGIKYNSDKMQAIINNYLLDADDELVLQEFNAMQGYRKHCKLIAKQILESIK